MGFLEKKYNEVIEVLREMTNSDVKVILNWIERDMKESSIFSPKPFSSLQTEYQQ